jgi:hypothetical protein
MSISSSQNAKCFRHKFYRNSKHIKFNFFFRKSCRLWDSVDEYNTAGEAINGNVAHAHFMLGTNTLTEYVIIIVFPLQQCLHESASLFRYSYIA